MKVRPQRIDDLTRGQHWYLTPEDECYYLCEYTSKAGFAHSDANSWISNFKKPVSRRGRAEYAYKDQAIARAINFLQQVFSTQQAAFWQGTTFVPVPPSKQRGDPEYDDRLWQVAAGLCAGTAGEARELLRQTGSYAASHVADDGGRIRPQALKQLYAFDTGAPPRPLIILLDDVLTTGCHFRAAKEFIQEAWPTTRVVGFFLARVARPDPADGLDALLGE